MGFGVAFSILSSNRSGNRGRITLCTVPTLVEIDAAEKARQSAE
jgi:hypothetical protein